MKISTVIEKIKKYHQGGPLIEPRTTRDQVLYGNVDNECSGIVTSCWASVDVIKSAIKKNANLIICHEALFWNHGDHTEWLQDTDNQVYLEKKQLLDRNGITVWRDHDYIHSGVPLSDGSYFDGIIFGLAHEMGWEKYITGSNNIFAGDTLPKDLSISLLTLELPEQVTAAEFGNDMISKLGLKGARVIGSPNTMVKKIKIILHISGDAKGYIEKIDSSDVDLLICMELVDFTLSEYIRDASQLGHNKAILTVGHFNLEEPGMKYMASYLPKVLDEKVSCSFVQSGDMYTYL